MVNAERPTPRLSRGIFFIVTICLIMAGIAGFILVQRSNGSGVNIASGPANALPVNVDRVEFSKTFEIREQYTGLVSSRRSSALGFESGGRVEALMADVGDRVSKGKLLAILDTRALRANLAAAEAQISEAEAALKIAEATAGRQKSLVDKGLLSSQGYDETEAQALAAMARKDAAKAQRDALLVRIELSKLIAPFDGVITRRLLDEGAIAAPGQPVVQIEESSVLETTIGVPSQLADRLVPGGVYSLRIDGNSVSATLRTITGVIDASQRTVTAVFDIAGEDLVYPGAVARLELTQSLDQTGVWIPISSMTEADRGLWSVYVVRKQPGGEHRVEKRLVDIIHSEADRVFVRGALEEGEYFVRDGLHRLTPNQLVEMKADKTMAAGAS